MNSSEKAFRSLAQLKNFQEKYPLKSFKLIWI